MSIEFVQRTDTYLVEARYEKPKSVFLLLRDLIAASGLPMASAKMLDIGCATGEMLYFLKRCFPDTSFTGVDNQPQLLEEARQQNGLKGIPFIEADALAYRGEPQDITTCFGMLGIFDDPSALLTTLLENTRKGGRVYVHALFNDDDIDVRVYYRDYLNGKDWNRGFNIFSEKQLSRWLESRATEWRFHPFQIDVDIPRRENQPHRAYTQKLEDGTRFTTNGLNLMLPEKILEITV